ncbi:hypothetical protein ABFU49_16700 [Xanthomonas campestris pv. campestris]|nr:hypothetical protein [Xanthomonas campestris]MBF9172349.1 hypothetical protein [Xanthomonas campestris pv. campestris]MDO0848466.1 hypothetical protein [Xanthomonas campestris pv. campestris]MEA9705243.1 hypothetical protein [Xanthomonas campestris pv. raphani]MEB1461706.1 hypothetical protein [Xanthomonas campestris pv. campestris]MEB1527346.1 hypothetical protein [Xanthomonas campestris pv. campestris]
MMVDMDFKIADLAIKLLTGIGQLAVACAVGYIAYRQWRTAQQQAETARNKLKHDLFERRLKVYDALRESAQYAFSARPDENAEQRVAGNLKELRWLFGKPVHDFVWDHIYVPLVDLWEANNLIHDSPPPRTDAQREERREAAAKASSLRKKLFSDILRLEEMMSDFLTLND